jgi:hypothetical protein
MSLRTTLALLLVVSLPASLAAHPKPPPGAAGRAHGKSAPKPMKAAEEASPHVLTPDAKGRLVLFADTDDDDDDGVADGSAPAVSGDAAGDTVGLPRGVELTLPPSEVARFLVGGRPWVGGGKAPAGARLQGLAPGTVAAIVNGAPTTLNVVEAELFDGRGARIDLAKSHLSISRRLPSVIATSDAPEMSDVDAFRWMLVGPSPALPDRATFVSTRLDGTELDRAPDVPLEAVPCPASVPRALGCSAAPVSWATTDEIVRSDAYPSSRWLQAEVGGRISLFLGDAKVASARVGGPRVTAVGSIERLRGRLRVHVLRTARGGMPAIGGDDAGARALAKNEIDVASRLWGQCGIHFGSPGAEDIAVHDPPPVYLLAVGCEMGLPASGGELRFSVAGKRFNVPTHPGQTPAEVAGAVVRTLASTGLTASMSPNPPTDGAPLGTADVIVRRADGSLAELKADGTAPLSSDPSLGACLGEVDFADGLEHFTDVDAPAGTVEERTLVKAFDDGDPTTIDVFIVPAFSGSGRIGESFVHEPGSSIQNVVILDRAGIRAGARSFVLAHELGHVLLDLPGHPDDFGVDRPTDLMDADAADPSMFGPRRLSIEECERAVRQSGGGSVVPLLEPWPLTHEHAAVSGRSSAPRAAGAGPKRKEPHRSQRRLPHPPPGSERHFPH